MIDGPFYLYSMLFIFLMPKCHIKISLLGSRYVSPSRWVSLSRWVFLSSWVSLSRWFSPSRWLFLSRWVYRK